MKIVFIALDEDDADWREQDLLWVSGKGKANVWNPCFPMSEPEVRNYERIPFHEYPVPAEIPFQNQRIRSPDSIEGSCFHEESVPL